MKKRKKIVSRLLCAALITATLPIGTPAVYAAEAAGTPSRTAYADKKGLQENYDLSKDTPETEKSVQRVYFGKNGSDKQQAWKIAGKDNEIKDGDGNTIDNIVLFADSAIKTPGGGADGKINFLKGWTYDPDDTVRDTGEAELKSLGITYGSYPSEVYVNHYGRSTLRSELKSMAGNTNYFTAAQQKLMNETTITTNDTKNDVNYTTTDVLYAAYGDSDNTDGKDQYIYVGTDSGINDLPEEERLKIDREISINNEDVNIWGKDSIKFWLRAPRNHNFGSHALTADSTLGVGNTETVGDTYKVMPAFNLNLTSVIFASAAPAASSQIKAAKITDDAMTFRWADETGADARIKSAAAWNASGVNVINGSDEGDVYLCVQGNNGGQDWIWSQKVSEISGNKVDVQTVTEDVKKIDSLADPKVELTKCKIWLETTDTTAGLTYAKEVQEGYCVNITAGEGLKITSDNASQTVNKGTDIGTITVTVDSNYYLLDNYITSMNSDTALLGSSGLTATKTDTGFTISGKPTRNVTIQLPAATAKTNAPKLTLSADNITRTKNSLIIKTDGFNTDKYGAIQYRCQQADANKNTRAVDWTEGTEISGLQAGTAYTIAIRYKGTDRYLPSEPSELTISTLEDTGNTDTDSSGQDGSDPDTDNEITGSDKNQSNTAGPRTGDNNSPALWLVLMFVSLAGVAAAFYGRRKRAR